MIGDQEVTVTKLAQPFHVTLSRGMKGQYGWEISISSETGRDCLDSIEVLDKELQEKYGGKTE